MNRPKTRSRSKDVTPVTNKSATDKTDELNISMKESDEAPIDKKASMNPTKKPVATKTSVR